MKHTSKVKFFRITLKDNPQYLRYLVVGTDESEGQTAAKGRVGLFDQANRHVLHSSWSVPSDGANDDEALDIRSAALYWFTHVEQMGARARQSIICEEITSKVSNVTAVHMISSMGFPSVKTVLLDRYIMLNMHEPEISFAFSTKTILDYLRTSDIQVAYAFMSSLETDEAEIHNFHDYCEINNEILFSIDECNGSVASCYMEYAGSLNAFLDYLSQQLQDAGLEKASKYIDARFEL